MKNQEKEKIRCTIRVTGCAGGYDPETPGYWPIHNHKILIDILDQGSKKGNEKSVLEKLNQGEFTIELDEEQDGIETLKKLFNKENVIKAVTGSSDLAPGILLSRFLDNLQHAVHMECFEIYVEEYGRVIDEDDDDEYQEYPNNINEDAFDEIISGGGKDIVFEKLEN
jgi:hypothetical protein